jgi:hypothetical protein
MNSPESDRHLEELLRRTSTAPLPDDGFSQRVLSALPPRARIHEANSTGRRVLLCVAGAAIGVLAAVQQGARWSDLPTFESVSMRVWDQAAALSARAISLSPEQATLLLSVLAAAATAALVLNEKSLKLPRL